MCGCAGSKTTSFRAPVTEAPRISTSSRFADYVPVIVRGHSEQFSKLVGASTGKPYASKRNGSEVLLRIEDLQAEPHKFEVIGDRLDLPEPYVGEHLRCDLQLVWHHGQYERFSCIRCGRFTGIIPRHHSLALECHRPGLGDRIAKLLSFVQKCGGCVRRHAWLNAFDRRWYRRWYGPVGARYYDGPTEVMLDPPIPPTVSETLVSS